MKFLVTDGGGDMSTFKEKMEELLRCYLSSEDEEIVWKEDKCLSFDELRMQSEYKKAERQRERDADSEVTSILKGCKL